ncbi:unnamed protein product [Cylicocyclus nassatus]|uniref:Uncharacterized protein n=1 Tax=Cylicocyclus nassatus TaxID=53992 RepID=A0AA36DNS6_CYLNA|nr:unnamed protein product [Cylicocyclus nassatus]
MCAGHFTVHLRTLQIDYSDDGIQLLLLSALDDCTKEKEVELRLDGSDQKAVQKRKAAAKRRREVLFAVNKKNRKS